MACMEDVTGDDEELKELLQPDAMKLLQQAEPVLRLLFAWA